MSAARCRPGGASEPGARHSPLPFWAASPERGDAWGDGAARQLDGPRHLPRRVSSVTKGAGMSTAARDYQATDGYRSYDIDRPTSAGWIGFAAVMLGFAGIWNTMNGIFAIGDSRVYANDAVYIFSDLNTWGWILTCLGILQLLA